MYSRMIDVDVEKLKVEASSPQNIDNIIFKTNQIASKIHVSYLFENIGQSLLQKLCLLLSATASDKTYGDWKKFAAHIGLVTEQIKCIEYDFVGLQDPTYYTLLAFAQYAEATIDKIFIALQKIGRLDVINRVVDCFNEFQLNIAQKKGIDFQNGTYKPNSLPRAPLVLSLPIKNNFNSDGFSHFSSSAENVAFTQQNKSSIYASKVMITFAEDGWDVVEKITQIFRSNEPRIGVVLLKEQEKHVYSKAEEFVEDCFKQVNYIVPVLTQGYINKINGSHFDLLNNNSLDSKYARYIYALLRNEYILNDCVNDRVRCIVPDAEIFNGIIELLNLHPSLQVWFRESDINDFINKILLQRL